MGQKVNPIGLRLGINRTWDSRWFAKKEEYGRLLHQDIVRYEWILIGIVVGSGVGAAMAIFMPMTAMPQRIALSHAFGALAALSYARRRSARGAGTRSRAARDP